MDFNSVTPHDPNYAARVTTSFAKQKFIVFITCYIFNHQRVVQKSPMTFLD